MVKYTFEHLQDYFTISTWDHDIDNSFGLKAPPGDWKYFTNAIEDLNASCPANERIIVVYAARHGEGEHNTLKAKYGIPEDQVHIAHPILDPDLTDLGRKQALTLASALQREVSRGMPIPTNWFVSPMKRASETCGLEWGWLFADSDRGKVDVKKVADEVEGQHARDEGDMGHGVPAVVVENIREHLHVHLCDSRLPISQLRTLFPSYYYPPDLSDEDTVWRPDGRETEEEMIARLGKGFEECLAQCGREVRYISLTSHSGAIRALCKFLGMHPERKLVVGEMNVLVLRCREKEG